MKRFILILSIFINHVALANTDNNLFDCMDKTSFEINSVCIEQTIELHPNFVLRERAITEESDFLGDNAIATLRFFPQYNLIEVIASVQTGETQNEF